MNIPPAQIPIIGQRPINEDAVKLAKMILAALEKGELINLAIISERSDGQMMISTAVEPQDSLKIRGAVAMLGTRIDVKLLAIPGR